MDDRPKLSDYTPDQIEQAIGSALAAGDFPAVASLLYDLVSVDANRADLVLKTMHPGVALNRADRKEQAMDDARNRLAQRLGFIVEGIDSGRYLVPGAAAEEIIGVVLSVHWPHRADLLALIDATPTGDQEGSRG